VWDGWNLVAEVGTQDGIAVTNTFTWGLDLSGSVQGAGGVGGLLAIRQQRTNDTSVSLPYYDGNGNVMGLVDATSGTVVAVYEYDPFGDTLRSTGPRASTNPWRFSTKYSDQESGWLYYGYRYYAPKLGRWASRDPMGSWCAINLHSLLDNHPIAQVDLLGLMNLVDPPWGGGGVIGNPEQGGGGLWSPEAPSGPSALQLRLARLLVGVFGAQGSIDETIFTHFATGGGQQLSIPSREVVSLVNLSLPYFRGGREAIADACRHCEVEGFVGNWDADNVSGALGAITFATEGAVESDGSTWTFAGTVWPRNEDFDFRPLFASRRGFDGNVATVIGQLLSWLTPAQTFPIVFEGTVRWRDQGQCP
jgi:RHS repeat-associated protein